ncbi:MAG TPA: tetratricopeptide repeat protein [Sphingobium sp.]|nr:tetratricopeptide repeat protein [Sphingobium sp.]
MIRLTRSMLAGALLLGLVAPAAAAATDAVPSTRGLYLQLISQARMDGRARAALAYLDDFDLRYPDDPDARLLRINSLLDLGDIDSAEMVARLPADDRDQSMSLVRGHLHAARGRWAEAIPFYQAATRAYPTDALPRNALGYAQLRAGQSAAAIETLRSAADLAPGDTVIRNNLLLALTLGNQPAQAAALLDGMADPQARLLLSRQIAAEAAGIAAVPAPHAGKGNS